MNTGREQEQSIKDRKALLYEDDAPPPVASAPSKPFAAYLNETPAAPIPAGIKAALWAVGAIVALILLAAMLKSDPPKTKPKPKAEAPRPAVVKLIA